MRLQNAENMRVVRAEQSDADADARHGYRMQKICVFSGRSRMILGDSAMQTVREILLIARLSSARVEVQLQHYRKLVLEGRLVLLPTFVMCCL